MTLWLATVWETCPLQIENIPCVVWICAVVTIYSTVACFLFYFYIFNDSPCSSSTFVVLPDFVLCSIHVGPGPSFLRAACIPGNQVASIRGLLVNYMITYSFQLAKCAISLKFNSSSLKNDGWKTTLSFCIPGNFCGTSFQQRKPRIIWCNAATLPFGKVQRQAGQHHGHARWLRRSGALCFWRPNYGWNILGSRLKGSVFRSRKSSEKSSQNLAISVMRLSQPLLVSSYVLICFHCTIVFLGRKGMLKRQVYIPRDRNFAFVRFREKRLNLSYYSSKCGEHSASDLAWLYFLQEMQKMQWMRWCVAHLLGESCLSMSWFFAVPSCFIGYAGRQDRHLGPRSSSYDGLTG